MHPSGAAHRFQPIFVGEGRQHDLTLQHAFAVAVGGVNFSVVINLHAVLGCRRITIGGVGGDGEIGTVLGATGVIDGQLNRRGRIGSEFNGLRRGR
ncbi:hypothetical protein D3C81_1686310 [compost metagenome]